MEQQKDIDFFKQKEIQRASPEERSLISFVHNKPKLRKFLSIAGASLIGTSLLSNLVDSNIASIYGFSIIPGAIMYQLSKKNNSFSKLSFCLVGGYAVSHVINNSFGSSVGALLTMTGLTVFAQSVTIVKDNETKEKLKKPHFNFF